MQYNVSFGNAFARDEFGFVRKGTVSAEPDKVVFSGKRSWGTLAKLSVLLLVIVSMVLFVFGPGRELALGVFWYLFSSGGIVFQLIAEFPMEMSGLGPVILAAVVIDYFCVSDGALSIHKASVTDVHRKGRQIMFKGQYLDSAKTKKTVFKVDTKENAVALENELRNK